jgi:hypothetical protein
MRIEELSNVDIDKIFTNVIQYGGCFSSHLLNNKNFKNNKFWILNLDKPSGKGSHWILVSTIGKTNMYYDSFGGPPTKNIEKLLLGSKKNFVMNPLFDNDQRINSITCGYFCILVALLLLDKEKPQDILSFMTSDTVLKNERVVRILAKILKPMLKKD